jgi:hypothetical protein
LNETTENDEILEILDKQSQWVKLIDLLYKVKEKLIIMESWIVLFFLIKDDYSLKLNVKFILIIEYEI